MLTYNEMKLAQLRYEDLNKVRGRAEIEPATVTINVWANAVSAVRATLSPDARKASRTARISRTMARHTLAAE